VSKKHWLLQLIIFINLLFIEDTFATQNKPSLSKIELKLQNALQSQGADYKPQTKHLLINGKPEFTNRLILEESPYLLQHAHNPVNWYAWGNEAFAAAKRENKIIFLSIGYSTCYWCHVMEKESFENKGIAKFLNENFINIKVDRERRPDVDAIYMAAIIKITGSGGWPMSSFLTPEGKTFIGGSYFSPEQFKEFSSKIMSLWKEQPQLLIDKATQVQEEITKEFISQQQGQLIDDNFLHTVTDKLLSQHDNRNGGFGYQPKFPHESWLLYLLDYGVRFNHTEALNSVELSLQKMSQGGIRDHIGGGFHRYSTDYQWKTPHFEKMLYTQAQLARVYLLAHKITQKKLYADIAQETLEYTLDELITNEGVFYSAADAGSQHEEGAYFLWTKKQVKETLPNGLSLLAISLYGLTEQGNFKGKGKSIFFLNESLEKYALQHELPLKALEHDVSMIKVQLNHARKQRKAPFIDRKILTSWNAMMITSLVMASEVLNDIEYLEAAKKLADVIWGQIDIESQQLWRVSLKGKSSIPASQEDYAYYAQALLSLYDQSGNKRWLEKAEKIADKMLLLFWDFKQAGLFMNVAHKNNPLILRPKISKDTEIASGNAIAMRVLSHLAKRTGKQNYEQKASQLLTAFSGSFLKTPLDHGSFLYAGMEFLYGEQSAMQYAAKGAIKLSAHSTIKQNEHWLELEINIQPTWHINSHQPVQDYLTPTSIHITKSNIHWKLGGAHYPKPTLKRLNFQHEILSLYEGKIRLMAPILVMPKGKHLLPVTIKLQACNNKICLPPEEVKLQVMIQKNNEIH